MALNKFARLFDVDDGQFLVQCGGLSEGRDDERIDLIMSISTNGIQMDMKIPLEYDDAYAVMEAYTQEKAEQIARHMAEQIQ